MSFTRTRGRPKKITSSRTDSGTPELVHKRAFALTQEALDLCYERNLITPDQHWCGIHLRWLYTLRYGAPTLRAVDPLHFGGRELTLDNPDWRRKREREYNDAIVALGPFAMRALALCVYNQRPAFLHTANPALALRKARNRLPAQEKELDQIRLTLDRLVALWCKSRRKNHPAKQSGYTTAPS